LEQQLIGGRPQRGSRADYSASTLRHKALLMYGEGHAQRKHKASNYDMSVWQAQSIVSILESTTPIRIFSIHHSTELAKVFDVAKWPVPSLAIVRGTSLGALDYALFDEGIPRAKNVDGKMPERLRRLELGGRHRCQSGATRRSC
jgi:hypothetical protein